MWKKSSLLLIIVFLVGIIAEASATGTITITAGTVLKTKYGQLTALTTKTYDSFTLFGGNGSIVFNVTGLEFTNHIYNFQAQAYGNGTWNILFIGTIPIQVTANNAQFINYTFPAERISYNTTQNTPLIVVYAPFPTEPQKVLFRDDFLYTNPLLESSWTIDQYENPGSNNGEYTSSGYLVMPAKSTSSVETVHVTNPIYSANTSTTGTVSKRKMTVSMIPFAKAENAGTAFITVGMAPLYSTGAYPGLTPSGTPNYASCAVGPATGQSIIQMGNSGTVTVQHCYHNGSTNAATLIAGLDPTLYTVATIETSGVFCSTCVDNQLVNQSWVFFRIYQEDSSGKVLKSTDKGLNLTSNVSPLAQTTYAFIQQFNTNSAATGQVSKIDLVQVQNYGSPVCLNVPGGTLCTRLPPVPNSLGQGVISDIAWLANQIGFGDEQIGALIMFLVLSMGFSFIPFILTRNYLIGGTGLLLVFSFFIYAGFLPTWLLFLPILGGVVLMVMLVNRMLGSHSLYGGGGDTG